MKKLLVCVTAIIMVFGVGGADAAVEDFESTALGDYTSLDFGDFTITAEAGAGWSVSDASPGPPISGHCITTFYQNPDYVSTPLYATFSIPNVNSFSIGVGDFDGDEDYCYLEVYDSSGSLLGSDFYLNPAPKLGGDFLTVSTTAPIAYAKFWDEEPYPNAVFWDNLSYRTDPVPEPANVAIWLLLGSLGLALDWRRRRRRAA